MSEPDTLFSVGPRDRGKRLDLFLKERIPGLSRARLQEAIRTRIHLSWPAAVRPATPVRPGGTVRIGWVPLPEEPLVLALPVLARAADWLAPIAWRWVPDLSPQLVAGGFLRLHVRGDRADLCFGLEHPPAAESIARSLER